MSDRLQVALVDFGPTLNAECGPMQTLFRGTLETSSHSLLALTHFGSSLWRGFGPSLVLRRRDSAVRHPPMRRGGTKITLSCTHHSVDPVTAPHKHPETKPSYITASHVPRACCTHNWVAWLW